MKHFIWIFVSGIIFSATAFAGTNSRINFGVGKSYIISPSFNEWDGSRDSNGVHFEYEFNRKSNWVSLLNSTIAHSYHTDTPSYFNTAYGIRKYFNQDNSLNWYAGGKFGLSVVEIENVNGSLGIYSTSLDIGVSYGIKYFITDEYGIDLNILNSYCSSLSYVPFLDIFVIQVFVGVAINL